MLMRATRRGWPPVIMLAVVLTSLQLSARPVAAEDRRDTESRDAQRGEPDFLFGAPKWTFAVRGGWSLASAKCGEDSFIGGSGAFGTTDNLYDFVCQQLTVEEGDFDAPVVSLDVAFILNSRLAAALKFDYSRASVDSEFRDFVDQDDNPITQRTELSRVPVTGNLKFYFIPLGREVSRYSWVPNSFAPYIGGGGGFLWYRFKQVGDFVDFQDLSIFPDIFISDGFTSVLQVFGGVDIKIERRFFLTIETGYMWAKSDLEEDFVDFDPIDLSGLKVTGGIDFVF
jgi:hypothetical protein